MPRRALDSQDRLQIIIKMHQNECEIVSIYLRPYDCLPELLWQISLRLLMSTVLP